jgi:hypothetical protein
VCKTEDEVKEFMKTRIPKIVFFLPQSYVEFDNYKQPLQTYMDATTFVMELSTYNFYVCNINLQKLTLNDYPLQVSRTKEIYFADYYNIMARNQFAAYFASDMYGSLLF